jgi:hypothetical protein
LSITRRMNMQSAHPETVGAGAKMRVRQQRQVSTRRDYRYLRLLHA